MIKAKFRKHMLIILLVMISSSIIIIPLLTKDVFLYGDNSLEAEQDLMQNEIILHVSVDKSTIWREPSSDPLETQDLSSLKTDRFIVKYKDKQRNRPKFIKGLKDNILAARNIKGSDVDVIKVKSRMTMTELLTMINNKKVGREISFIQPDYTFNLSSNDTHYSGQWGLENHGQSSYSIDAGVSKVWEQSLGEGVIIAIIDTGIDISHEDLTMNIWDNTNEIPGNNIDDDKNGYVDDINGWNFFDKTGEVFSLVNMEKERHGTHIAGIIAATRDNGVGIAGVAPLAKVMPLKVFDSSTAYTSDIIEAINYAEANGAKIVNCSWGSTAYNPALKESMDSSSMLFICAAGNFGLSVNKNPIYPATLDCKNVISVASVNKNGLLSAFSNYGENEVDVAAPGEEIMSTVPGNKYVEMSGTSMAAAFVSAEAALLVGIDGNLNSIEIMERIVNCSEKLSSLTGKVYQSNKINCSNAVGNLRSRKIIDISGELATHVVFHTDQGQKEFVQPSKPIAEGKFVQVAYGDYHTIALRDDGTVWVCGNNKYGQLGDGTTLDSAVPVQVSGLDGITAIAGGEGHCIALKNDGTVWTWGSNKYGQLGDSTTVDKTLPVQVSELYEITAIASGAGHSIALKNDGAVWAWGYNKYGQLGDGTTKDRTTPVQINGLSAISAIAGGSAHSIALNSDGTVWIWGSNEYGQLGDSTLTDAATPIQVAGLSEITAIAGGFGHSIALKNDGIVWAWGLNCFGQLGDGTTTSSMTPIQVKELTGVLTVVSMYCHNIAIKDDGIVWSWGSNSYGQLGDGTTTDRKIPVQVSGISGVIAIAGGVNHSIVLKDDGTAWAWGSKEYGQLGDGTTVNKTEPVQSRGLVGVTSIASGFYHSMALKDDDTVWTWGNNYGQLGEGITTDRTKPVQVSELSEINAIAGGIDHSIALKNDGTVWTWGSNEYGQLGDGTTTNRTNPAQINGISGVTAIAGGYSHTIALKDDGTVWAWGWNNYGQLGDGTTIDRTKPVQINGISGVTAIAGGYCYTIALKNDGTVWAWGLNQHSQLGDGTTTSKTKPVQVNGLNGISAISSRFCNSIALKNDGTVWTWGWNDYGQLGDGTTISRSIPVQVNGLTGITEIAVGSNHSVALKNDGTIWAWGWNRYGQLGDDTAIDRLKPVQVNALSQTSAVASGAAHSMALKSDGTVWTWGYNFYGQLGNGEACYYLTPKWSFGTSFIGKPVFDLVLEFDNISNFSECSFSITYNTDEIAEVVDLCVMTYPNELITGEIKGVDITITQNDPGIIRFTVKKSVPIGQTWSGVVNIIKFRKNIIGQPALTYEIQ